jgi:type IV secretion system protein TrbI
LLAQYPPSNSSTSAPWEVLSFTRLKYGKAEHEARTASAIVRPKPAGSKILGEAKKVDTFGQVRLAVTFHRLIMPDGFSVNLDQFKGLDQAGATALKDKVNNHYVKIFGASLALGVLGGVAQIGTGSALTSSGTQRIQEGFGVGMASAGEDVLDRFLNILPTVTIREGTRVKVYLSNDLLLPEYSAHNMPSNL